MQADSHTDTVGANNVNERLLYITKAVEVYIIAMSRESLQAAALRVSGVELERRIGWN